MQTKSRLVFETSRTLLRKLVKNLNYVKIPHKDQWEKKDKDGRFHITYEGECTYHIHYDVNTADGRHMTLPSITKIQEEFNYFKPYFKRKDKINKNIKQNKPSLPSFYNCIDCGSYCKVEINTKRCDKCKKAKNREKRLNKKKKTEQYAILDKTVYKELNALNEKHLLLKILKKIKNYISFKL